MGLAEYKRKRRFERTPEPAGEEAPADGWSFVVQKHDATRLHYDFRLELDGVLKSWAVPKGPSLDPGQKRFAVQVEDHPIEYGDFEGVIPADEYGGGTVLLWDRGTWEPIGDAHEGLRTGKLKFRLDGEKLRGAWMLVRIGKSRTSAEGKEWLLFKERDAEARAADAADILDEAPLSVATGRDLDAIATARDREWNTRPSGNGRTKPRGAAGAPAKRRRRLASVSHVAGVAEGTMPAAVDVQLATLTEKAPTGREWLHEIKFDGYRMLCRIEDGNVEFVSRNRQPWGERFPTLVTAARLLPVKQALLDGEVVALRADGASDFQTLQNAFSDRRAHHLRYYAFDLLHLDGYDLTSAPLEERKRVLADLLSAAGSPVILLSEHAEGDGPAFFREACKAGLEGIISKRRDRPYRGGRGYDWLKSKCVRKEEFVVGGYTDPQGSREGFGALLLGYYDEGRRLLFAGKVGTGFDTTALRTLAERLRPLERRTSPFALRIPDAGKDVHWVEPTLVAQVSYANRTQEGIVRHASFQGLREDKPAADVREEEAVPVAEAMRRSAKKPRPTKQAPSEPAAPNETSNPHAPRGRGRKRPPAQPHDTPAVAPASDAAELYDARRQTFAGVRLTSPEKVLYPDDGITKLELADYYRRIAPWILPHLAGRLLTLVRCPDGQAKKCFYQKHPPTGTPPTLRRVEVQEEDGLEQHLVVDDVAGLISLAQIAALEVHVWGSREDNLERPDRLVFDLDPDPSVPWPRVVASAREVRDFLAALELTCFLKTTGGKGLHLVVPIDRRHDWDEAKAFCKLVAESIVAAAPRLYTANMSKAARGGKVYIDYHRNDRGSTAVAPYSTRARPGATVSTPLAWDELTARVTSDKYSIRNLPRRLASLQSDPWQGIDDVRQGLAEPLAKLRALREG